MIINSAKYSCAAGHEINEDSLLCSAERGIFIVADGLGGHSDGEKASLAAVDYFEENCLGGYTSERISELIEGANTEVIKKGDGGKTTVAAAFTENGNFIYANVGDSRVYYFRDGKIIAQTKDHSVCQASVDMGMLRPEDIRGNEDRSRLLKVLGSEERLNIKKRYPPIKIQNGDAFLVCSDGFWEYVYEDEMEADLLKSDSSDVWLKHMLKRHILRAENKGDNYTAVCGIIYLDGSENFDVSPAPLAAANNSNGKGLVPLVIAGAAVIVLAAALSVFLLSRDDGADDGGTVTEITESSIVSETTVTEEEVPAETTTTTIITTTTATTTTTTATETTTTPRNRVDDGNGDDNENKVDTETTTTTETSMSENKVDGGNNDNDGNSNGENNVDDGNNNGENNVNDGNNNGFRNRE